MVDEEALITISEASRILGVSEPALRQWTDEGKIKAFITPGGHRRYSRAELKKFVSSQQKMLGVKDLVIELEETARTHREMDASFLHATLWYDKFNEDTQKHLASLGRRFLSLVIKSVTEPSKKEETLQEVRDVGHDFGETLAKLGLPLTDSIQAFVQHRDPIVSVVTGLMKRREALNRRIVEATPLINRAMDEALISLVAAHQQYRDSFRTKQGDSE